MAGFIDKLMLYMESDLMLLVGSIIFLMILTLAEWRSIEKKIKIICPTSYKVHGLPMEAFHQVNILLFILFLVLICEISPLIAFLIAFCIFYFVGLNAKQADIVKELDYQLYLKNLSATKDGS